MTTETVAEEAARFRAHWFQCVRARLRQLGIGNYEDYGAKTNTPWDGGTNRFGRRQANIWPKIIQTCRGIGHDPFAVALDICEAHIRSEPPYPTLMLSPAVLDVVVDATSRDLREETKLKVERTALAQHAAELSFMPQYQATAWHTALSNRQLHISPLHRYCEAKARGYLDIAAKNYEEAALEYVRKRETVDRVWPRTGLVIPAEIRSLLTNDVLARRAK